MERGRESRKEDGEKKKRVSKRGGERREKGKSLLRGRETALGQ